MKNQDLKERKKKKKKLKAKKKRRRKKYTCKGESGIWYEKEECK